MCTARKSWSRKCVALVVLAAVSCINIASATLGGDRATVAADIVSMNGTRPAQQKLGPGGAYAFYESVLPSGTRIRQYVNSTGEVFAVSWSGPRKPDLRQLMGRYFDIMVLRKKREPQSGHTNVVQHESDLVVESGGHPHHFLGRAYLPRAWPDGVSIQAIQ